MKAWALFWQFSIIAVLFTGFIMLDHHQGDRMLDDRDSPTMAVEQVFGKNGTMLPGGVFKIGLSRDHPRISVGDVLLRPALVFDSWAAFMKMGNSTMMMGDLVLTADEIWPVQDRLQREGIDITAIHNTLIGATPQVYDLHISGRGDPVKMAEALHSAMSSAKVSYEISDRSDVTPSSYSIDKGPIDGILGVNGTLEDGVLHYDVPRAERITENGMEIPPSLDVAISLKFQPLSPDTAAVAGEYVLTASEVTPVFRALNKNGIMVTALHTHMLTEQPRLFYLHFWATGDQQKLARGLREALDQTNSIVKPL